MYISCNWKESFDDGLTTLKKVQKIFLDLLSFVLRKSVFLPLPTLSIFIKSLYQLFPSVIVRCTVFQRFHWLRRIQFIRNTVLFRIKSRKSRPDSYLAEMTFRTFHRRLNAVCKMIGDIFLVRTMRNIFLSDDKLKTKQMRRNKTNRSIEEL